MGRLEAEKFGAAPRAKEAIVKELGTMPQVSMLSFHMEAAVRKEEVTARAGLALVIEVSRALGLEDVIDREVTVAQRQRRFSDTDKMEAFFLLIAAGGDRVEDIRILSEDEGLLSLLDRKLPSPDVLLDFLQAFDDPVVWKDRPSDELSFVPPETSPLQGLGRVNQALIVRATEGGCAKTATVDHDGTIIESHKQDATIAYEGTKGYQPLVAVWAEEELILVDEFRDGNVPGGKDPLSSVKRAFEALPEGVTARYFRGDSADYYAPLLKWLVTEGIFFTISADMTQELRKCCGAMSEENWEVLENRATEIVHLAELEFTPGDWEKEAKPLRYVGLRITPRQGVLFEEKPIRYLAYVSNRRDLSMKELVRWHWGKAGTIEHVHRVMKDELGAGVLPSVKFGANAAWFRLNVLTYNLLSVLKRRALPERYLSARPKRLRFEVFTIPARIKEHEGRLTACLSAQDDRVKEIIEARRRLVEMNDLLAKPVKSPSAQNQLPAWENRSP